ncbi:MAG TPA: hypothetical protein VF599_12430 [Pyrinomonadaceae bacterium]|jgi:hypothetical protein
MSIKKKSQTFLSLLLIESEALLSVGNIIKNQLESENDLSAEQIEYCRNNAMTLFESVKNLSAVGNSILNQSEETPPNQVTDKRQIVH